ncbi:hypothetical protein LO772_29660 [Yinghuangia sp. ASG 101]|uniref:hypothetical protein n=1 Tax=Yinghuangia sp. ASG 101 TaxID=2896848 RepID=UPI001E479E5F|nr:hypothetical protein [Yinghuangia sp. ASG 101]UGQ10935.1 hypothetical protein LO772_29660 [Yinghuangia sp. ASG 101]
MRVTVDRFTDAHQVVRHIDPEYLLATAPHMGAPSLEGHDHRYFADRLGDFLEYPPNLDDPHEPFLRIIVTPSAAERSTGALTDASLTHIALRVIEATYIDNAERCWAVVRDDERRIHILTASCGSAGAPLDLWDVGRRAEAEGTAIARQLVAEEKVLAPDASKSVVWYEPRLVLAANGPFAVHGADARARRLLDELGLRRVDNESAGWHRTPFGADAAHCRAVAEHIRRALESAGYQPNIVHLPAATTDQASTPGRGARVAPQNFGTANAPGFVPAPSPRPAWTPSSGRSR